MTFESNVRVECSRQGSSKHRGHQERLKRLGRNGMGVRGEGGGGEREGQIGERGVGQVGP